VLQNAELVTEDLLPELLSGIESAGPATADPQTQISPTKPAQSGGESIKPLWLTEKDTIESAIAICEGNVPRAAALLEVSPSTIYRKRQSWEGD